MKTVQFWWKDEQIDQFARSQYDLGTHMHLQAQFIVAKIIPEGKESLLKIGSETTGY